MNRRKFFTTLGVAATGISAAVGTGAFTSVEASRRIEVETANDNNAFLRLEELGGGKRSIEDDGQVEFSFPGLDERIDNPEIGLGVDSVYEFDRDAGESGSSPTTEGLLRIENQGTQPVEVYSEHETDSELEIELYDVTGDSEIALRDDPPTLDVGDSVDVGFRIRTHGASVGEFEETMTIVADQPDD
ncbi:hypothetical protein [Halorubrum sp. FL23]|uniref:hypothetical protein n=1 Tax=Halorubrum sp. FL23 TaxID=3458704 RepID=UPI00403379DF